MENVEQASRSRWVGIVDVRERGCLVADRVMSIESLNPESSKEAQWLSVLRQISALFFGRRTLTV
jgi:hypothetical protein